MSNQLIYYSIYLITILAFASLLYLIFNRKKKLNQNLPLLVIMSLYFFSFTGIGIFIGHYLGNKKITVGEKKGYKYSAIIRDNGDLIMAISIFSLLFNIKNLINR